MLAAIMAVLSSGAIASAPSPSLDTRPMWTMPFDSARVRGIRTLEVGPYSLTLNTGVTLADVIRLWGRTRLIRSRGHDVPWRACYHVPSTTGPVYVVLASDQEMGGPAHEVLDFTLSRLPPVAIPPSSCALLAPGTESRTPQVITRNGLFVGMRVSQLRAIMGPPMGSRAGRDWYEWVTHATASERTGDGRIRISRYLIGARLRVTRAAGRVTRLDVEYMETT